MLDRVYGVCSNTKCGVIMEVPSSTAWTDRHFYCPKCGSELISACPHCHRAIIHREGVYCFYCSRPIKVQAKLVPSATHPK